MTRQTQLISCRVVLWAITPGLAIVFLFNCALVVVEVRADGRSNPLNAVSVVCIVNALCAALSLWLLATHIMLLLRRDANAALSTVLRVLWITIVLASCALCASIVSLPLVFFGFPLGPLLTECASGGLLGSCGLACYWYGCRYYSRLLGELVQAAA